MEFCVIVTFLYLLSIIGECVSSCSHDIPHGKVTWWCDSSPCPYSCDEGYEENQAVSWLSCSSSGEWFPIFVFSGFKTAEDLCIPKPCLNEIPNGELSSTCASTVGSTCEYSCNMGYQKKIGVSTVTCQISTHWSIDPHSLCTSNQQCAYEVANGDLDLSCRRIRGETCNYTCREGYLPSTASPARAITCESSLIWSQPRSSLCEKIQCPSVIPNGAVSPTCSREYNNQYCHDYGCNTGYEKPSAPPGLKCNASGQWEWGEHQGEPCARKDGLCPSNIRNGNIVWHCHRQPGAHCTYSCNAGCTENKLISWLTCGTDGRWDKNTDNLCTRCRRVTTTTTSATNRCPFTISNGYISFDCNRSPYSTCGYTCDNGCYSIYSSLYCTTRGYWNNGESACRCQGSGSTSGPEYVGSSSTAVIIGVIGGVLVMFVLIFICVWICCKRQHQAGSNSQSVRYQDHAITGAVLNGRSNGVSAPVYMLPNQESVYTSLQQPNNTEQSPYMQLQSPTYEGVHIHEPPEYSSIAKQEPSEDPPSYEQVISHPSEFKV